MIGEDFFADLPSRYYGEGEPSFSFAEFRKWLAKQKDSEKTKTEERQLKEKDELKQKFKEEFKKRIRKKK